MSQIEDKKIIKWIRSKNYSKLSFLEKCWSSSENEWYLGFYYFVQDLKQRDKESIFKEISLKFGSEAKAYLYLGNVAKLIFNRIDEQHFSASFYRKSIQLDEENSIAHWELYKSSNNLASCLDSLKLDYKNGELDTLKNKINDIYPNPQSLKKFSKEDWLTIKNIIVESEIDCHKDLLILAYLYLNDYEKGIDSIEKEDKVNAKIVKEYYDKKLITKDYGISKINDWEIANFISEDHKRIYLEHVKEFKKGKLNPTRGVLIYSAFRAEEFHEVIFYYKGLEEESPKIPFEIDTHIYYLLSQLYLNKDIDEHILSLVNNKVNGETNSLYMIMKLKIKILQLEKLFSKGNYFNHDIRNMSLYKEALKILDISAVLNHFLYDSLNSELNSLKIKWDKSFSKTQLIEFKEKLITGDMDDDDFFYHCFLALECDECDYVIEKITEFHKNNEPSMSSFNCLGVSYQRKGMSSEALNQYENAVNLMHLSGENNHVIIRNYWDCAKESLNFDFNEVEIKQLKEKYNTDLINQFEWNSWIATKYRNRLFKYSPFNINTIDSLTNQYFYLPNKDQLNDPIELPNLENVHLDDLMDSNYRICSFSNNDNSMLMWSHYAQQHQGIMVEYKFRGDFPDGYGIGSVSYTDDIKRFKEKDLYVFNQYVLTKNKEWAYEEEVRLFSNRNNTVSYESFDYPNHDRNKINAEICSITLGCQFPKGKKQLISKLVKLINSNKLSHELPVLVREAYVCSENIFSLKYRIIEV
ncbi:DUF2971 domain-containing protein [Acinetobacter guillouiae]|uniref:DUF2971 domain-containing protein n=1 Tax=Acinetobacter guillouiae TaxID=106649 RepID=UPI003AF4FCB4